MHNYILLNATTTPTIASSHLVYNESISNSWELMNGYLCISNYRILICNEHHSLSIPLIKIKHIMNSINQLELHTESTYVFVSEHNELLLHVEKAIFTHMFNQQD